MNIEYDVEVKIRGSEHSKFEAEKGRYDKTYRELKTALGYAMTLVHKLKKEGKRVSVTIREKFNNEVTKEITRNVSGGVK